MKTKSILLITACAAAFWWLGGDARAAAAQNQGEAAVAHVDLFAPILLELAFIVILAVIGRMVAIRFKQPPVLGELIAGVVVSNIGYHLFDSKFFSLVMHLTDVQRVFEKVWATGKSAREVIQSMPGDIGERMVGMLTSGGAAELIILGIALWIFSNLGVILLLFIVGYEMRIGDFIKVGPRATLVAFVGVVTPFVLGFAGSALLLPQYTHAVHIFMGGILCATSVGITARVFKDLDRLSTPEATMILGAAVIDDVLGLIVLAVVGGIAQAGHIEFFEIGKITLYSILFLGLAMLIGEKWLGWAIKHLNRLAGRDLKLLLPLSLAFVLAWTANLIGLAPIVGAFTAGLIISEDLFQRHPEKRAAIDWLAPVEAIFAPIFFVLMGMQVDLAAFGQPAVVGLGLAFIVAAVAGKLVCGVVGGPGVDPMTIGIGMIPRGEVGLIFASIGKSMGVLSAEVFSAVVIVVVVSTLITPVGLKWAIARAEKKTGLMQ
ncbi:cation:proton antiporter [bacterium]|nr:cation:proton antiporter [bacterium]